MRNTHTYIPYLFTWLYFLSQLSGDMTRNLLVGCRGGDASYPAGVSITVVRTPARLSAVPMPHLAGSWVGTIGLNNLGNMSIIRNLTEPFTYIPS